MHGWSQWSERMENTVGFENSKRLDKGHVGMEPPPFACVPHPVDVEVVSSHAVDSSKRRIELLATIVLHARSVTLHEAKSSACPCAADVDNVVPLGWFDLRQEARLQHVADEGLAGRNDRMLLQVIDHGRRCGCPDPLPLSSHIDPLALH